MSRSRLEVLMGAYYHEDFDIYDGTIWGPLDTFLANNDEASSRELVDDIRGLLRTSPSERELDDYLEKLGSNVYRSAEDGGYHGWLEEIARRVEAAHGSATGSP